MNIVRSAADPGEVRWVRTNPPSGRVYIVVENARTATLYQSSSAVMGSN